jgi:DNA invertase Pin-like site-specific DNA recombinase
LETVEAKGVTFKVLNINLDTSTPTGKLMLTMLGGIAEFEREMMLDRRAEGIARAKSSEVKRLEAEGLKMQEMADQLGIGVASVYRILS